MKLYRFPYSPYARKVQVALELVGVPHEVVDVPYSDRTELAALTGGYIYVPVLVEDDGTVIVESRAICERIVEKHGGEWLVPPPLDGPIWAYNEFCDGSLEDVVFRIGSPAVRDSWPTAGDRALYVLVKERKFGAGCVDAWLRDREALCARAKQLLLPTLRTLREMPFVFGSEPTLADCALYGDCIHLEAAGPGLLARLSPELVAFCRRLESRVPARRTR